MKNLSVRNRLRLLISVAIVALMLIEMFGLYENRHELREARQTEIKSLVESAHAVITSHYQLAQSGDLPEALAKQKALSLLEQMKYRESEYFFVLGTLYF